MTISLYTGVVPNLNQTQPEFDTNTQDFVDYIGDLAPELNTFATDLNNFSTTGTSTTSNTIGTGSKSFTSQTGKSWSAGQSLTIARTAAPTNRMLCVVTSYNSGTGALVVTSQQAEGSGTFTDWTITLGFSASSTPNDLSVTEPKLAQQVFNALTTVTFDPTTDTVPIADNSDSGNKKKALLPFTEKLQSVNATVAGNAMTLTLNPTQLDFRSSTIGSGTVNTRVVSSAITTVISSGSTGGTTNGVLSTIAILAIDNAGTVELAWCNLLGTNILDETQLISTTAEGGAGGADSANVIYSTTSRSNVPFRIVGLVESTQATAGTWATSPSKIQGAGGGATVKALSHVSGTAPIYGVRAWGNFNGTGTVAIRASGNVTSVTDNGGSGDYTITFATAMPDTNYAVIITAKTSDNSTRNNLLVQVYGKTTTTFNILTHSTTPTATDAEIIDFVVMR